MGLYIQTGEEHKQQYFVEKFKSARVTRSEFLAFRPGDGDRWGVCVVSNGFFDAAGIAFSRREAQAFIDSTTDPRPRTYYILTRDQIASVDPVAASRIDHHKKLGEDIR